MSEAEMAFKCALCNVAFTRKWMHHEHSHSFDHHKKVAEISRNRGSPEYHNCVVCDRSLNSLKDFSDHLATSGHKDKLAAKLNLMRQRDEWSRKRTEKTHENQQRRKNGNKFQSNKDHNRAGNYNTKRVPDSSHCRKGPGMTYGARQGFTSAQPPRAEYIGLAQNSAGFADDDWNFDHNQYPNANWGRPLGFRFGYNQPDYTRPPPPMPLMSRTPFQAAPFYQTTFDSHCTSSSRNSHTASPNNSSQHLSGSQTANQPVGSGQSQSYAPPTVSGSATEIRATATTSVSSTANHPVQAEFGTYISPIAANSSSVSTTGSAVSTLDSNPRPITDACTTLVGTVPENTASIYSSSTQKRQSESGLSLSAKKKGSGSKALRAAANHVAPAPSSDVQSDSTTTQVRVIVKNELTSPCRPNTEAKAKKKLPPAGKCQSLKGLLVGHSSRQLEYKLEQAVKERRTNQGRRYEIAAAEDSGLPDNCTLENVGQEDIGEVEALLSSTSCLQKGNLTVPTEENQPGVKYRTKTPSPPSYLTTTTEPRFAATMDSTRGAVNPSEYVKSVILEDAHHTRISGDEPVDPSPVVAKGRKRKSADLSTTQSSPTPANASNPSPRPKNIKTTAKKKAGQGKPKKETTPRKPKPSKRSQKKSAKAAKKSASSSSITSRVEVAAQVSRDTPPPPLNLPKESDAESKQYVIKTLLDISIKEETMVRELSALEADLKQLIAEKEKIDQKVDDKSKKIAAIKEEEVQLRESRLEILKKASESVTTESSTVINQADTTCTAHDHVSYIGGFITSDAEEEEKAFSALRERARHMSQGSDEVASSDSRSCRSSIPDLDSSSCSLQQLERKMKTIVEREARRKTYQQADSFIETVFEGHVGAIHQLVVKGDFLYSCSGDHTLRRYDIKTGYLLNTFNGHEGCVKSFVVLSKHDEKYIVYSVGMDGLLLSFDVDTSKMITKSNVGEAIMCVVEAWGCLYMGLENGDIVSYNIEDRMIQERYHTSPSGIMSICATNEGARRLLICGTYDCIIAVRDVKSGLLLRMLPDSHHLPRSMVVDATRPYVYVSSNDVLKVYNYEKACVVKELHSAGTGGKIRSICISKPEDPTLITVSEDGKICQYNLKVLELINIYQLPTTLLAVTYKKGKVFVGDQNGSSKAFVMSTRSIHCQIGNCRLPYAIKEDLINHVFTAHLTEIICQKTCPWSKCSSLEHHKSTSALRNHLYQQHLTDN